MNYQARKLLWLTGIATLVLLEGKALASNAPSFTNSNLEWGINDDQIGELTRIDQNWQISQLPNPITPKQPDFPVPIPVTPPSIPIETDPPTAPTQNVPEIPGTIRVERFEFEGNTAFGDSDLAELTKQFIGREVSFAELLTVEEVITRKYVEAGYINSGAIIPADQTFKRNGAVIKVQILEGGLEEIKITGTKRLNPSYIRSRLEIATRAPLNRNRLLEALQLLQLDPQIANISAELQTGTRPEKSRLEVRVKEGDTFSVEAFADNSRSPSVGSFRRGLKINQANLIGFGDGLSMSIANSDGSNEIDASYTIPVNPYNGTVLFGIGWAGTEVIEEPFDQLEIEGRSWNYDITYRQPVIDQPSQQLALGLNFSYQYAKTTVLGEDFPLSPGASEDGETRISSFRFFQEYVRRSAVDVFAARSQFSLGVDLFDATINEEGPDGTYFSWRGQAQYVRQFAPDTLLIVRSDAQLSADQLLPLEQIGIGGSGTVRGYRQDFLLADNGILASAEMRFPIFRVPQVKGVLQVAPFVDFGVAWNSEGPDPNPDSNSLLGAGVGLIWQMGTDFSARLDYAFALTDVDKGDRTWQENGIYFTINYFPF